MKTFFQFVNYLKIFENKSALGGINLQNSTIKTNIFISNIDIINSIDIRESIIDAAGFGRREDRF